ncbi:hypothetical protein F2Q69_00016875 [Brassica cretica]|uniref:CCHC-type domain-containing protein n=1 Tax=Brassica cretica TaxID=69181 RepID=A0A8S9QXM0_BRACR|nr:hypothetical protein F2Q69_00016875 [Brassica cretica]
MAVSMEPKELVISRDVRQGVRQEVLQRAAVSNKPKVVHKCNNIKVKQEVLKHGCAAGTSKETDRCIINCVRQSKKQHRMCCWFCGKVGHKKVECFARENSRNMAKKTSEDGCNSGRSDLEVDQEASSLEPGHEVICGTKGKEIERTLGVDGKGLMVKKTTHEESQVLNRRWSKGSSTGASGRDAVLVIPLQQGLRRMVYSGTENTYLMGEKNMVWCTSRGEKSTFGVEVSRPCGVKMLSWSRVDLESNGVSWRYGKKNKLEEQVNDLKKMNKCIPRKGKLHLMLWNMFILWIPWKLEFQECKE